MLKLGQSIKVDGQGYKITGVTSSRMTDPLRPNHVMSVSSSLSIQIEDLCRHDKNDRERKRVPGWARSQPCWRLGECQMCQAAVGALHLKAVLNILSLRKKKAAALQVIKFLFTGFHKNQCTWLEDIVAWLCVLTIVMCTMKL